MLENVHVLSPVYYHFKINFFRKLLSEITSHCKTIWIQIRPNNMSGTFWVETVCKSYPQKPLILADKCYLVSYRQDICRNESIRDNGIHAHQEKE